MPGITHVVLGSNDLARSKAFYDAALAPVGFGLARATDDVLFYMASNGHAVLVRTPVNGQPATFGNGGTLGLSAEDRAAVDSFHAAGVAHGGSCEGAPGKRDFRPDAYGAYLRDPDGNKLCAFTYVPD